MPISVGDLDLDGQSGPGTTVNTKQRLVQQTGGLLVTPQNGQNLGYEHFLSKALVCRKII